MASAMAAMPGSVSVACSMDKMASSITFTASAMLENTPNSCSTRT